MLAQKKKVMMMSRPSRVPAGYRELAYIEATGEQYIDLNMSDLTRFVVDFALAADADMSHTNTIVSASTYQARWIGCVSVDGTPRIGLGTADETQYFDSIDPTQRHTYDGIITSSRMTVESGGYTISRSGIDANRLPKLFAMESPATGEIRNFGAGRYFVGRYWQSGTTGDPFRFTVPVERVSDGEAGIYDMIHDVFLGNAGSGMFGKGPYV